MSVLERACKETATCHASSDPAGTLNVTRLVKIIPLVKIIHKGADAISVLERACKETATCHAGAMVVACQRT
jgi:hypothetical protein